MACPVRSSKSQRKRLSTIPVFSMMRSAGHPGMALAIRSELILRLGTKEPTPTNRTLFALFTKPTIVLVRRTFSWTAQRGGTRGTHPLRHAGEATTSEPSELQPQVRLPDGRIGEQLRRRSLQLHAPCLDDVAALGDLEHLLEVLLDEEHGDPGTVQGADDRE